MKRLSFVVTFWVFLMAGDAWAKGPPPPMPEVSAAETLLRLGGALVLVCLFAWWSLRWGLKRYQPVPDAEVRVRARVAVEPRRSILLVEVGPTTFVVASTEQGMHALGTMPSAELPVVATELPGVSREVPSTPSFASVFRRLRGQAEEAP